MSAPRLFRPPSADGSLTPRQQFVYDLLASAPRSAEEVGAWLHQARRAGFPLTAGAASGPARPCSCSLSLGRDPCAFAAEAAWGVLRALRKRELVVRRRESGLWERRDKAHVRSSQGEEIPF